MNRDSLVGNTNEEVRICVLQRGWVLVGIFNQSGPICRLTKAKVIRIWGATKGLGEIAMNGPTDKTILDPSPITEFHELTVILMFICNKEKWMGL